MHRNGNVVGHNIARLRYERGLTQNDLATKLQLVCCDVSRQIIAHIETGRCAVPDCEIVYFAHVFSVKVEELFPVEWRDGARSKNLVDRCPTRFPRKSRLDS
jgi:transcriptional regulator with XRE-family HTH domain